MAITGSKRFRLIIIAAYFILLLCEAFLMILMARASLGASDDDSSLAITWIIIASTIVNLPLAYMVCLCEKRGRRIAASILHGLFLVAFIWASFDSIFIRQEFFWRSEIEMNALLLSCIVIPLSLITSLCFLLVKAPQEDRLSS